MKKRKEALVFDLQRTGYSIDQVENPMTVGDLIEILERFDEDTLVILGHDRRYTFGTLPEDVELVHEETDEDGDSRWVDDFGELV